MDNQKMRREIVPQPHKGWSHFGWCTRNLAATEDFWVNVLGFKAVKRQHMNVKDGDRDCGRVWVTFFYLGDGHLIEFSMNDGLPDAVPIADPGINDAFGLPDGFYHFAFDAGPRRALERRRQELMAKGVAVTEIIDEGWRSLFFFKDPNGLTLAFTTLQEDLAELINGVEQKVGFETGLKTTRVLVEA